MGNYCVVCGVEIPEGRQACPNCREKIMSAKKVENREDYIEYPCTACQRRIMNGCDEKNGKK